MTAKTDLTAQIAVLNRVLAEATKEHLACQGEGTYDYVGHSSGIETDDCPEPECKDGRVARFPGFRLTPCHFCGGDTTSPCEDCDDKRYLIRAGGLEDALAGLTRLEAAEVLDSIVVDVGDDSMPSADVILLKGLELVVEVAGL